MSKRVLVTGATGALAPAVIRAFRDGGYDVRAFVRRRTDDEWLRDLEIVEGDIGDRVAVACAVERVDVVVHLAALLHIVNPSPELEAEYQRVNVEGTRVVAEEAMRAGVRRLVLFSTIAVYGYESGAIIDESTPIVPSTFYAKTKAAAEEIVLATPIGVVIRLAAAYGPRIKGNYLTLLRGIARGRFIPIGRGENRRTLIHEDDAGRAALFVAEHDARGVFNVTDGVFHTVDEIVTAIYAALGRRKPRFHLPIGFVSAGLFAIEMLFRIAGRRPRIGRFSLAKYTEDVAVRGERLQALGFTPKWSLENGWRETVRVMRERGEI